MSIESILEAPAEMSVTTAKQSVYRQRSQWQLMWGDLLDGLKKWRIWLMLAHHDIKLRYRRSILGPFWITLSMAITAYSMGFLYAHLFHTELQTYFPYLVSGMLTWTLLSMLIIEHTEGFAQAENLIKQIKLPYSLYIHKVITRNLIIFAHNLVVMIPVLLIFHQVAHVNLATLLLIPDLLILYLIAFTYGLILAMVGARYRDISQIIKSLIQVVFFVTPVMWNPSVLPADDLYLVYLNPFYGLIEIIREPLMGKTPSLFSWLMVMAITLVGITVCLVMFKKYRARIVYWL